MNNADNLKKIKHYFEKGLNATEIAKLLDLSPRTCQRYIKTAGIGKEAERPKTLREKAAALVAAGFSYAETAARRLVRVCPGLGLITAFPGLSLSL